MTYWFEDPILRNLASLAWSTSTRGLMTRFATPRIFVRANVMPTGPVLGATARSRSAR